MGAADLWAAADPSWDGMSGERERRGRLCEHIGRLRIGIKWAYIDLSWVKIACGDLNDLSWIWAGFDKGLRLWELRFVMFHESLTPVLDSLDSLYAYLSVCTGSVVEHAKRVNGGVRVANVSDLFNPASGGL